MNGVGTLGGRLIALLFAVLMGSSAMAAQPNYAAIYVFGDSLSDTGNDFAFTTAQQMVPAVPPSVTPYATYWQGRFSNGPVAVEYLWQLVSRKTSTDLTPYVVAGGLDKKTSVNFAFGGAGSGVQNPTPNGFLVPGLTGQVGLYTAALAGKKSKPNALYVVWSGANDYLQNITHDPSVVVDYVTKAIRALYDTGARDFLVPNLPDLGGTPLVKAQGASAAFTTLAKSHNALLASSLNSLAALPGIRIVRVDVFTLGDNLVKSGLVNADVPALAFLSPGTPAVNCLFLNPASCVDVPLAGFVAPFLYWDVLHPTTQVHGIIGTAMYNALLK
jgi:phospholipase/lecithinase/hemolysin